MSNPSPSLPTIPPNPGTRPNAKDTPSSRIRPNPRPCSVLGLGGTAYPSRKRRAQKRVPHHKEPHLRAITKARWDALHEEYLVYKQSFVDEVACTETEMHRPGQGAPDRAQRTHHPKTQTQTQTTLKSLFSHAFQDQDGSGRDTEGHIVRPRPPVSIMSTLARAWTRCVFDPYLSISGYLPTHPPTHLPLFFSQD